MNTGTDRIEKKIILRAPRNRVWRALTDAGEFGSWFGVKLDGPFVAGAALRGVIMPTTADPAVAQQQEAFSGTPISLQIERIEPERLFSFRWHPFAIDPGVDYASEPTTLVTFELAEVPRGALLTVTESGFDQIPLARRAQAFSSNEQGWAIQVSLIEKHLARTR